MHFKAFSINRDSAGQHCVAAKMARDRTLLLLSASWTWAALLTSFVRLRLYCRIKYQRKVWWDDWWGLVALVRSFHSLPFHKVRWPKYPFLQLFELGHNCYLDSVCPQRRRAAFRHPHSGANHDYLQAELDIAAALSCRIGYRQDLRCLLEVTSTEQMAYGSPMGSHCDHGCIWLRYNHPYLHIIQACRAALGPSAYPNGKCLPLNIVTKHAIAVASM